MKIELRHRKHKSGNQTLYLEFYDGATKQRYYESLNLFLIPEYTDEDRRINEHTLKTAQKIKAERVLGITHPQEDDDEGNTSFRTLAEWMDDYLEELRSGGKVSEAYCIHMRSIIKIVMSYLSYIHRPRHLLSKVDKEFFRNFLRYIRKVYKNTKSPNNPKPLSENTLLLIQTGFCSILNKAVKDGHIKKNPFYELENSDKIHKTQSEREFLTVEELKAMSEVYTGSPMTKQTFMFCCFTGLRHSDMAALRWRDIEVRDGMPVIHILSMKKTRQPLTVPLNEKALEWLPERGTAAQSDLVFPDAPSIARADRALKHMAKRAGINKVISFHCSRHTFATLTITVGADLYITSKLLGHTNIHTTEIYADVIMDKRTEAVNLTNGLFG